MPGVLIRLDVRLIMYANRSLALVFPLVHSVKRSVRYYLFLPVGFNDSEESSSAR